MKVAWGCLGFLQTRKIFQLAVMFLFALQPTNTLSPHQVVPISHLQCAVVRSKARGIRMLSRSLARGDVAWTL